MNERADFTADDAARVINILLRHGEFGATAEASRRNASVCAHEILATLTDLDGPRTGSGRSKSAGPALGA